MTNGKQDGFAADWLALREPADHAARNAAVHAAFLDHAATLAGTMTIVDMGAGTGSTARALAPAIARANPRLQQRWILVDADKALLCHAARRLADPAASSPEFRFETADLADPATVESLAAAADVVTGSALIDLVSAEWLNAIAAAAERHRCAMLFALNYSGEEHWAPPHPADGTILAAFLKDQRRDKGFGPALGPEATRYLAHRLGPAFEVTTGSSDWRLGRSDAALIEALAGGIVRAAVASGEIASDAAASWLAARRETEHVVIGHEDIFARPL